MNEIGMNGNRGENDGTADKGTARGQSDEYGT